MKRILMKRAFRDLIKNWARYLALSILIIFSIYMVCSMIGSADTVIEGSNDYSITNKCEDGEFSTFVPLKKKDIKELKKVCSDVEEQFYLGFSYEDEKELRVFKIRESINLISLVDGEIADSENELVLERRFAEVNKINVGDKVHIGNKEFTVSGIGVTPDYNNVLKNLSDSAVNSETFGLVFVTEDSYEELVDSGLSLRSEEYTYAFILAEGYTDKDVKDILKETEFESDSVDDEYFQDYFDRTVGKKDDLMDAIGELKDGSIELSDGLHTLEDNNPTLRILGKTYPEFNDYADGVTELASGSDALVDGMYTLNAEAEDIADALFGDNVGNMKTFLKAEDNIRIGGAENDVIINKTSGAFVGILLIILCSYILSVFVVHTIDQESSVIGALYSMGVRSRELLFNYIFVPVIVVFISGLIGLFLSFSPIGILRQMQDVFNYYSCPNMKVFVSPILIIYAIVMPPIVAMVVNILVIRKRLKRTPLSLLKNEAKASKIKNIKLKEMKFIRLFKLRQMIREMRTGLAVVFGLFLSLLVAMLSVFIYVYCNNVRVYSVEETKFEYMYTYKYPSEKAPEGGYQAIAVNMKKDYQIYNFDVTFFGIEKDNPFFDLEDLPDSQKEVIVGSCFAEKYSLKPGDEFTLTSEDGESLYAFTIKKVIPYSSSMFVFMDIDRARELFGYQDDYYNVIFSDKALDIPGGRLYNIMTKDDVKKSADIFMDNMFSLIVVLGIASAVIFVTVMYLMMKMMIDKSSFNIALVKIFGFRNREVKKMYLDGNFYIVAIGALISIPLCKLILDYVFPNYMVTNVAVAFENKFPWYIYVGLYIIILILYFIINNLLIGRIKKMVPAEVLKNRE
ncbi:MAG: ABC transporter permease [Eubacterium sp.]|nr:ABC transporter permease [Eubacterium sp.]